VAPKTNIPTPGKKDITLSIYKVPPKLTKMEKM
jgi:hypothetical protein